MAGEGPTGEQLLMRLLQTQQEQMGQLQRLLEQNQRPRGTVVDTKAIGRPEKLGGTLEEASRAWRQWNYRLELWLTSQFPETRAILTWARTQDEEIAVARLREQLVEGVTPEKVQEFNRQLEVVLGTLTMDTPGDITMNSSAGSGLDMYRRLHGRLDPTDMVTSFRWLRQLMSTKPVAEVSDLIAAVERWEDQRRTDGEEPEQEEDYEAEVGFIGMLEGEGEDPGRGDETPKKPERKEKKEKKNEKEEKKQKSPKGDDEDWGTWRSDPSASGAGSSRDPPEGARHEQGNLLSELQASQAELNRALASAESDEERANLEAELEEVTRQLKELVAKRRAARTATAGSWKSSARFLADVRSGRKAELAKRKELSRQRAAKHRQASREGRARERVALDEEWQKRYNKPLKKDDGKKASYPLMPENTDREARPLSKRARENLRQEGAGDDVPEEHVRSWREKPKTPGERAGKRRREAARKKRKEAASGTGGEPSPSTQQAEAIRTAPWRNDGKLPGEQKKGGKESGKKGSGGPREDLAQGSEDSPGRRPVMGRSKLLGAALAGALQAQAKRMPKEKIIQRSQVRRLVEAHKGADRFAKRQESPGEEATVGVVAERRLLDSDCESCTSRRGKATKAAAAAYAKSLLQKRERMKYLPLLSEDEGEEDHVPLGGRGPEDPPDGEGGLEGRVILDSGASHNVLPDKVYQKLFEEGRATALKEVSSPLKFSTASGESLPNLGTTELLLSGPSSDGRATRCRCIFNVAAVQRCLLSTGRAMDRGNALRRPRCAATEYYNLFPEPEVFPIHSDGEEDEARPFGNGEPRQAEPASGSAQPGGEEAQRAKPLRAPPVPTPQMVAEHEVTHIPYRSWCPACVAGRGRAYSHHHEGRDSTVPVVSADYLYFSEKGVPGKRCFRDLNWLGYKRLVLKTDQENAIKALGAAVKAGFPEDLTLEESPKGDSHGQSNGTAENSVQRVQGQVRTMKYALEQNAGGELPKDSVIFPWMIEYAGVLHTLFSQEDSEGMTPFQKLKGRTWQVALPSFGEIVDYRRRTKSKLDARWQEGVYLGLRLTSSEKIIGTPSGILVVQSIRRKPADKQFNLEMLKAVKGTPWQLNPEKSTNADADRLPEPIVIEPVVEQAELPPKPGEAERLPTYRRMYIRQSDLEQFGYTGGCEACAAIREGRERQGINHNETCRKRIQEALKDTSRGQARLERETQRETEYFTKVHEAEEKKRKAATEKEKRPEAGGAEASEPSQPSRPPEQAAKKVEKRKPSNAEPVSVSRESKKPAVTASEAASASKRKSEDPGDQERSELRPAEDRAEGSKRKAENIEGMIETLIAGERKAWIESLEGVEQPTCDLVDGLVEEVLAETFYDDLTGKELPAEGVKAARAEEVSVIRQMGVWEVIPRPANEKVIGTRWVDINKGDGARHKLRSRLVAQELKRARGPQQPEDQSTWSDFFAAMPPLSSLRALFSLATTQRVPNTRGKLSPVGSGGEVCLMFLDVKKAHFWSPVRRRLLVELPPEAGEGRDKVGLLKRSLYGTRDAPSNWEKAIKDALEGLGFKQGKSNPCLYFHEEKSLRLNVHGDDFTVVGSYKELKWLEAELGKVWTVETRGILARPGSELPGVIHQISVLNRLVTWTQEGIEMEADPRHVDLVLEQLGLEKGVSVTTPLVKVKEEDMDKTPLGTAEAALYRSIAMRIGYLSMDRPDLLRTVRELAKGLKEPQQHHWGLLKRAARYLRGSPRLVQLIPYQEHFTSINAWSDSDHAGCIKTRKSTTGTVIQLGEATVKTAAKGQAVIALSTGEAEYYGLISTASTTLGEQAMMADWGVKLSVHIAMDASAGISIGSPRGLGKVKHIDTCYLWVQEIVDQGRIRLKKVNTQDMLADLMTKPLDGQTATKLLSRMGYTVRSGKHELALGKA
ncbi:unnamed protein product [Symbiodinium sp. CCMP2592]|nr:unnamed protein product [Symbiodinium sp. CCMP2592]